MLHKRILKLTMLVMVAIFIFLAVLHVERNQSDIHRCFCFFRERRASGGLSGEHSHRSRGMCYDRNPGGFSGGCGKAQGYHHRHDPRALSCCPLFTYRIGHSGWLLYLPKGRWHVLCVDQAECPSRCVERRDRGCKPVLRNSIISDLGQHERVTSFEYFVFGL